MPIKKLLPITAAKMNKIIAKIHFEKAFVWKAFAKKAWIVTVLFYIREEIDLLAWGAIFMPFIPWIKGPNRLFEDNKVLHRDPMKQNLDRLSLVCSISPIKAL